MSGIQRLVRFRGDRGRLNGDCRSSHIGIVCLDDFPSPSEILVPFVQGRILPPSGTGCIPCSLLSLPDKPSVPFLTTDPTLPQSHISCQTISLLCGNLGNSRIGKIGDSIFCRHRFSNSFLHCSFYHLWFFSNPNWLHCQLGLDFKREIKNISLWDDGVCNAGNIIRNNLPTYLS